jgi:hypothetical protein
LSPDQDEHPTILILILTGRKSRTEVRTWPSKSSDVTVAAMAEAGPVTMARSWFRTISETSLRT